MSVGGSMPFARKGVVEGRLLPLAITLTVGGSGIGALLLLRIPTGALQLTMSVAMIAVAAFSLARQDRGTTQRPVSSASQASGYVATFVLAVYGGFFSGGYVTTLTAAFVLLFGLTFLQSVAMTKIINFFSSLVATIIFASHGIFDYRLGAVLGVTMFLGAVIGGHVAMRLPAAWLRRIFIVAVVALAANMAFALIRSSPR